MSKRTYDEAITRKNVANEKSEKKMKNQAKTEKLLQTNNIKWATSLSLVHLSEFVKLYGSHTQFWERPQLLKKILNNDTFADFRNKVKIRWPDLYEASIFKSGNKLTGDIIQTLKLYYLSSHQVFYMAGISDELNRDWILEFKLLPEVWWSERFQAVLQYVTIEGKNNENEYSKSDSLYNNTKMQGLVGTTFEFFRNSDYDWEIDLFGAKTLKTILMMNNQSLYICWDFFWSTLWQKIVKSAFRHSCQLNAFKHGRVNYKIESKQEVVSTRSDVPWTFHYETRRSEHGNITRKLFIPPAQYPKTYYKGINPKDQDPIIMDELFIFNGRQKQQYKHTEKMNRQRFRSNCLQYSEYLQAVNCIMIDKRFWKEAQQQKEVFFLEILTFLI